MFEMTLPKPNLYMLDVDNYGMFEAFAPHHRNKLPTIKPPAYVAFIACRSEGFPESNRRKAR